MRATPNAVFTGQPTSVTAEVSDPSGVASVFLRWRYKGEASWRQTLPMASSGGSTYSRQVPGSGGFPTAGAVLVEVTAKDTEGNLSSASVGVSVTIP